VVDMYDDKFTVCERCNDFVDDADLKDHPHPLTREPRESDMTKTRRDRLAVYEAGRLARRASFIAFLVKYDAEHDPCKPHVSPWPGVTVRLCEHMPTVRCNPRLNPDHYRKGVFPLRVRRNREGAMIIWVPQEVMPSVCARIVELYKVPVYRSSKGAYYPGRGRKPIRSWRSKVWNWSLQYNRGES
jgi:hypothetical protein